MRMTLTEYAVGTRNMLICAAFVLVSGFLVGVVVSLLSGQPLIVPLAIAFGVSFVLVLTALWWQLLGGRKTAGAILLDCGPNPYRKSFITDAAVVLILSLLLGCSALVQYRLGGRLLAAHPDCDFPVYLRQAAAYTLVGALFFAMTSVFWAIMASGRLQIRERGIWRYFSLLKWHSIRSYRWGRRSALVIKRKSVFPWGAEGVVRVPPELKDSVEALLKQHLTTNSNVPSAHLANPYR